MTTKGPCEGSSVQQRRDAERGFRRVHVAENRIAQERDAGAPDAELGFAMSAPLTL